MIIFFRARVDEAQIDLRGIKSCMTKGILDHAHIHTREWVFGHFHAHRDVMVRSTRFHCIGAIDGSDHRPSPIGYLLDTDSWLFSAIPIGDFA